MTFFEEITLEARTGQFLSPTLSQNYIASLCSVKVFFLHFQESVAQSFKCSQFSALNALSDFPVHVDHMIIPEFLDMIYIFLIFVADHFQLPSCLCLS